MTEQLKITTRQVNNLRAESMRWAAFMLRRLRMSVIGEPAMNTCECGKEYELFPNQPITMNSAQVNAAKYEISKIYPDISPQDLAAVTDTVADEEQTAKNLKDMYTDKVSLSKFARTSPQEACKMRDYLIELTQNVQKIA